LRHADFLRAVSQAGGGRKVIIQTRIGRRAAYERRALPRVV